MPPARTLVPWFTWLIPSPTISQHKLTPFSCADSPWRWHHLTRDTAGCLPDGTRSLKSGGWGKACKTLTMNGAAQMMIQQVLEYIQRRATDCIALTSGNMQVVSFMTHGLETSARACRCALLTSTLHCGGWIRNTDGGADGHEQDDAVDDPQRRA